MKARETWKPVTIGGLTGIMMGAGTMYAVQAVSAHNADELSGEEGNTAADAHPNVLDASDSLSFSDAFAAGRAASGPGGLFTWRGNLYGTYTADEWNALSEEEKDAFAFRAQSAVQPDATAGEHASVASRADDTQVAEAAQEENGSEDEDVQIAEDSHTETTPAEAPGTADAASDITWEDLAKDDGDVRVVGYREIGVSDDESVVMQELEINGQRVAVIDVDKDGVGDLAMSDLNHNYQMDDGEVIDLETGESVVFTNDDPVEATSDELTTDDSADIQFGML